MVEERYIQWFNSEGGDHSHAYLCSSTGVVPARPLCGHRVRLDGPNDGDLPQCQKCRRSGLLRGLLPIFPER